MNNKLSGSEILLRPVWLGLLLSLLAGSWALAEPTWLVEHGQARAQIVVGDQPGRMAQLAAKELQNCIETMSGARLPIVAAPDEQSVSIFVGLSVYTQTLGLADLELRHGAYRITAGPRWLALFGSDWQFEPIEPYAHARGAAERRRIDDEWEQIAGDKFSNPFHYVHPFWNQELGVWDFDDAGTFNAVCDFLRSLGVRWYYPGDLGEIVPRLQSIALPTVDRVVRPDFALRKFGWWSKGNGMTPEEDLWSLRLGLNQGADLIGVTQLCHGAKFVLLRDEFKQAHPEMLALYNGKRAFDHKSGQGAPCLSSPEFYAKHLQFARAIFDHYDEPMLSIDVPDGYGRGVCQCPACADKGTPQRGWNGLMSDYVLGYMDRLAADIYRTHPDKLVSALAYGAYTLPPSNVTRFTPNLALWICQSRKNIANEQAQQQAVELRQAWLDKLPSGKLFIYDYYMDARPDGAWRGIPVYFPHRIAVDLRSLKGVSSGEYIDLYQPHDRSKLDYDYLAVNHLNLYVTARLWWDAQQDVDVLLDEYCQQFYGPAGPAMRDFIDYSEQNWAKMRKNVESIDRALALIAEARAAAGDSVYGQRVQMVARYVEPLRTLRGQLLKTRDDVPEARALARSARDLKLDGVADEPMWNTVREFPLQELSTGRQPQHATTFRVAWVDDSLCLAISCRDDDAANLAIGATDPDDPNIWEGDVVEILLETQYHTYYQIAVNPAGTVVDLDRENSLQTLWSSGARIATSRGPGGWTIEARLPAAGENAKDIDALQGIAGDRPTQTFPWFINICRQRVRGSEREMSAWSPTGTGRFNVPSKFGKLYVD